MKKNIFKFGIAFLAAAPLLVRADFAEPAPATGASSIPTPQINTVQGVLNSVCVIFAWAFYFLVALAVLFIVIAAFKFLTASGDTEKVRVARSSVLYAAIAVAVALLAKGIPLMVQNFLGAQGDIGVCGSVSGEPQGTSNSSISFPGYGNDQPD